MGFQISDRGTHIEVCLRDFVTIADTCAHFDRLSAIVSAQRARLGVARVVVDATAAQPQSAEVAELMSARTRTLYLDSDKVAVLTTSALLKAQIRRVLAERVFPMFADRAQAEAHARS